MRSIYQPSRVTNCIDRIRGEKPFRPLHGTAAKVGGERKNETQIAKAKAERQRKYNLICELIRSTSPEPVTCDMAGEACGVARKQIFNFIATDPACPFTYGAKVGFGTNQPRRLVIKKDVAK